MSVAAIWLTNLKFNANFLLNLYLPTLDKLYLLGSKNIALKKFLAASIVGSSPLLEL